MNIKLTRTILLGCLVCAAPLALQAAAPREGGGDEALRKAQYMLQKLAGEKAALEKENLRLAEELKGAQAQLDKTGQSLNKLEKGLDQAQQRNASLVERVRSDHEQMTELQVKYRNEIGDARADIQLLSNAVAEREAWIADCRAKNEGMYQANLDLLNAYEDKSAWDALKQGEGITGIAKVEVETLLQDYQFRLDDLRTVKFESTSGLPGGAPAAN